MNDFTDIEMKNVEAFSSDRAVELYADYWVSVGLFVQEKNVIRKYFVKEGARVLDIGCGTGRTTYPLHKMGFNVIGIDISEPMIQKAKTLFPEVNFRTGDACELEFESVLFSYNGMDCIFPEEKRLIALREIHRVLKPAGIFVFSAHNSWPFIYARPYGYFRLLKFLAWNIRDRRIFSKYKTGKITGGEYTTNYYINPFQQRRQLEACGFELREIMGRLRGVLKYFEPWPYYVAQKR